MGFNPMEVNSAARKAARMLGESGAAGRVEKSTNVIAPEGSLLYGDAESTFVKFDENGAMTALEFELVVGETYRVRFKGTDCTCVAKVEEEEGIIYIGNLLQEADKEPFSVLLIPGGGCQATFIEGAVEFSDLESIKLTETTSGYLLRAFTITQETETIHPIDRKFISGAVLPVVELETILPMPAEGLASGVYLSSGDGEKLTLIQNMPFVLKFGLQTDEETLFPTSVIMSAQYLEGFAMYSGAVICEGLVHIFITNDNPDGGWTAAVRMEAFN